MHVTAPKFFLGIFSPAV